MNERMYTQAELDSALELAQKLAEKAYADALKKAAESAYADGYGDGRCGKAYMSDRYNEGYEEGRKSVQAELDNLRESMEVAVANARTEAVAEIRGQWLTELGDRYIAGLKDGASASSDVSKLIDHAKDCGWSTGYGYALWEEHEAPESHFTDDNEEAEIIISE